MRHQGEPLPCQRCHRLGTISASSPTSSSPASTSLVLALAQLRALHVDSHPPPGVNCGCRGRPRPRCQGTLVSSGRRHPGKLHTLETVKRHLKTIRRRSVGPRHSSADPDVIPAGSTSLATRPAGPLDQGLNQKKASEAGRGPRRGPKQLPGRPACPCRPVTRAQPLAICSQGVGNAGVLVRRGRVRTKVAPRPGPGEEAVTSPPWARAMLRAMVNPMPEPVERRGCPGAR